MVNYKIAVIHSKTDEKRGIKAGEVERIGDINDEDALHSTYILEYAKEKYSDIEIFNHLNYRHKAETIGYFLTLFGDIIFFNTTKNVERYGKSGLFLMPNEIADQKFLYDFAKEVDDFSVDVSYDLTIEAGILVGKEMYSQPKQTVTEVFDLYFSKMEQEKASLKK